MQICSLYIYFVKALIVSKLSEEKITRSFKLLSLFLRKLLVPPAVSARLVYVLITVCDYMSWNPAKNDPIYHNVCYNNEVAIV